jgi:predicted HTH domain antitoxin
MEQLVVDVPDHLLKELEAYRGNLGEILALGLRQIKMQQALALFREAGVSLWKTARMAGVSLREMTEYAVSQGLRASCDEKTLEEELA